MACESSAILLSQRLDELDKIHCQLEKNLEILVKRKNTYLLVLKNTFDIYCINTGDIINSSYKNNYKEIKTYHYDFLESLISRNEKFNDLVIFDLVLILEEQIAEVVRLKINLSKDY